MNLSSALPRFAALGPVLLLAACASLSSPPAGLVNGRLPPCSPGPHCVSSQAADPGHAVDPWQLRDPAQGWARVIALVAAQPRTRIVAQDGHYLHAEVLSPSHLFTDDLELLRAADGRVDVRSSSRVGYYDFGVNRKRVAALRAALAQAGVIAGAGG